MPPKPKFTRSDVIDAAYTLLEQGGMDAVVAREVAKKLGCTVAPIFTCFENMDELKAALHDRAMAVFADAMRDCTDYFPAFKEFGLRWLRLAGEHPHVYCEIFLHKRTDAAGSFLSDELWEMLQPVLAEITATFSISQEDAACVMKDMLIYAHGLAAIRISGQSCWSDEELRASLSRMCISIVAGIQARNGAVDEQQLHMMLAHVDMIPQKKAAQRSEAGRQGP